MIKLPITAIVVMYNEQARLADCLGALVFCDQIIAVDLGSTDRCVEIARSFGAEVLHRERMPHAEPIQAEVALLAKHDWIMRTDPDEVYDAGGLSEVAAGLAREDIAIMRSPYQYYFKGRALSTTVWGGIKHLTVFFHRRRVRLLPLVHSGIQPLPEYQVMDVDRAGQWPVRHYWVDGYGQLWEKHRRYLRAEGAARLARGQRFSWPAFAKETLSAVNTCLLRKRGWLGGWRGISLSFFYAWYVASSWLSLRREQKRRQPAV